MPLGIQIEPSFWVKLRRLCVQHLDKDDPCRAQIDDMIDQIQASALGDRHMIMAELFAALGHLPNAVELGFLIGERVPLTAYGVLCLGVLTAPTIGGALRFVADVHHLEAPLIALAYEETATEGRFTIGFRSPIDNVGEALIVAICTAAIEREIARRSGRSGNFARLELTPGSKGFEASYHKCLSLKPHTDCKSNRLIFRRSVLDLPNARADADTFKSIVQACAKQAELQVGGAPLQERMRETIMTHIGAPPSLERLAKTLGLTSRQLRVRLSRARTSYQAIIRDCRIEYASALFKNPALSLSQVADRLGYSDVSAFSHAFYRWTGKSPSIFRAKMLALGEPVVVSRTEARHYARSPRAKTDWLTAQRARPAGRSR